MKRTLVQKPRFGLSIWKSRTCLKETDTAQKFVRQHIASHTVHQTRVSNIDPENRYRMLAFIPALDAMLIDYTKRFGTHFANAAKLSPLIASVVHNKSWDYFKENYKK